MSETEIDTRLLDKQPVYIEDEGIYILKGRLPGTGTWYYSAEKYASDHDAVEAVGNRAVTWVKERGEERADD